MFSGWSSFVETGSPGDFDPGLVFNDARRDMAFFMWCCPTEPSKTRELDIASVIKYRYGNRFPDLCKITKTDVYTMEYWLAHEGSISVHDKEAPKVLRKWCMSLSSNEDEVHAAKLRRDMALAEKYGWHGDGSEGVEFAGTGEGESHVSTDSEELAMNELKLRGGIALAGEDGARDGRYVRDSKARNSEDEGPL